MSGCCGTATEGGTSGGTQHSPRNVYVRDIEDFPQAVAGVITCLPDTAYMVEVQLDLLGARMVLSSGTVLRGTSSETSSLSSTTLGALVPFITAAHGGPNPIQNISVIGVGIVFDIDGLNGANAALDWSAFNLINCTSVGLIRNISNLIINTSAWINTGGLVLDGNIGTFAQFQHIWQLPAGSGATAIDFLATCVVSRRFRSGFSPMNVPAGTTGINVANRVLTFPVGESFSVLFGNFTGAGTFLVGASFADDKTTVLDTLGLVSSSPATSYNMQLNAVVTPIAIAGTFVLIAGVPVVGPFTSKFTVLANRATYTGAVSRFFNLSASVALASTNNNTIAIRFAINGVTVPATTMRAVANAGGRVESLGTIGTLQLNPGDFVELFVTNTTAANAVTVSDMQVGIGAVGG